VAARRRNSRQTAQSKAEREFVSEAEEILETMRTDISDLGDVTAEDVDPDLVNRLFRSAHSLKALAAMFRYEPIEDLAHGLEDILDGLRLGRIPLGALVLGLIDESTHLFGQLLERFGDDRGIEEGGPAIEDLSRRIAEAAQGDSECQDELEALDIDASLLRALTEYEEHRLRENLRRGRDILLVEASFDIGSFEERLSQLTAAMREAGELISTLPTAGASLESQIQFSLLLAANVGEVEARERLDFEGASVREVRRTRADAVAAEAPVAARSPGREGEVQAESEVVPSGQPEAGEASAPEMESLRSISETVRVDIRKLDELMNLVGELVIQRSAMGDLLDQLGVEAPAARTGAELGKVHKAIDRKLRELQSAVLDVRMVPLRQVFEKVSRVVRRMRRERDIAVRLEVRGADTELDKLIVEALVDPLMHIIRNALDHGIEGAGERLAASKREEARISIEAFQRGNHVVIAVTDDGRGIDTAALRAKAEARGLLSPGTVLAERESLELIFAPGLSTRGEVSETSGRGVGMDVVRANLGALGGIVDVESTPGHGTTISITLPITLAIIQSLIVRAAGQRFAIPLNSVLETLAVDARAVQRSEGREFLNLRGEALPFSRLATELELAGADADETFAVVMGMGDQRIGMLVSAVEGQQDTVVKAIQGPIQSVRGVAGATELGDQEPVLVLDVSAFIDDLARRKEVA
jgi:two-component system chemotaxis sensor kinase CheA